MSSLTPGRTAIHVDYAGTPTFTPSAATIVENVRLPRSRPARSAALELQHYAHRTPAAAEADFRREEDGAVRVQTTTFLAAPAVLGAIASDDPTTGSSQTVLADARHHPSGPTG